MEFKLYRCAHCGNIAWKIVDTGVALVCCGENMGELVANVTDGAVEKHVPVLTQQGDAVKIEVGSVAHPMLAEHSITVIAAVGDDTVTIRKPKPGDAAVLETKLAGKVTAYEYCNLHGYWKGE